jgi:hypothetical protein
MIVEKDAAIENLRSELASLAPGTVDSALKDRVLGALQNAWKSLCGADDQKTYANKLKRAEYLCWRPPILSFKLERHGRTVNHSTRADLHHWEVNVDKKTAEIAKRGTRQLYKQDNRLNTKALAQEIAEKIKNRIDDPRLEWDESKRSVTIIMEKTIPSTVNQTTQNRRKRFRRDIAEEMNGTGWERKSRGNKLVFEYVDRG